MPTNVKPLLVWNFDHPLGALSPDPVIPSVPLEGDIDETKFHANGNRLAVDAEIVAESAFPAGDGKCLRLWANPSGSTNLVQPKASQDLILDIPPGEANDIFAAYTFDFRIKFDAKLLGDDVPVYDETLTYNLKIKNATNPSPVWHIEINRAYVETTVPGSFFPSTVRHDFDTLLENDTWYAIRFVSFNGATSPTWLFLDGQPLIYNLSGGLFGFDAPDQIRIFHEVAADVSAEPSSIYIDRLALIKRGQISTFTPSNDFANFAFDEKTVPTYSVPIGDFHLSLGVPFNWYGTAAIEGGTPPYAAVIFSGSAPPGVILADLYFEGTPLAVGSYSLVVKLVDSEGIEGYNGITFVVTDDGGGGGP